MSAIDSDALKEYIKKTDLTAVERGALLQAISNMSTLTICLPVRLMSWAI